MGGSNKEIITKCK